MTCAYAVESQELADCYGGLVTDSQVRELERRWRETGAVEDEAKWLLERVRGSGVDRG